MTPNPEKKHIYKKTNEKSLKHNKIDGTKENHKYKNILTENKSTNFNYINSAKYLNFPKLKNNFLKNKKIDNLNSFMLNKKK